MALFSHIYIEEEAMENPLAKEILKKMNGAAVIRIKDYREVFCRPGQDFQRQKKSLKLILAVKKKNFLYPLPAVCQDFGFKDSYYTSPALNCIYDCGYCFLQGMHPSAYITAFVNTEDFFTAVRALLKKGPVGLSLSYDSDILALENVFSFAAAWMDFAFQNQDLNLEIRTKSVNTGVFLKNRPSDNIIPAWTLLPEEITARFEKSAPSPACRLEAIGKIMDRGWKVRLCFDPLILMPGWEKIYPEFIKTVFTRLPAGNIRDVSIGVFRMNGLFFKKMKNTSFYYGIHDRLSVNENGVASYSSDAVKELQNSVFRKISHYLPENKIFI